MVLLHKSTLLLCYFIFFLIFSTSANASAANDSELALTLEEKMWIADKAVLNVGTPNFDFPPYVLYSGEGKVLGIYHDYLQLVAGELGLKLRFNMFGSVAELEQAMAKGEIDVVVGFTPTLKRQNVMAFSEPFMIVPRSVLVKKSEHLTAKHSINEFEQYTFALERGFASRGELRDYLPEVTIFDVDGTNEAISAIKFDLADAYYGDWITNNYILDKLTGVELQIVALSDVKKDESRFALPLDEPLLLSSVNKVLKKIDDASHANIAARWHVSNLKKNKGKVPLVLSDTEKDWLKDHPVVKFATNKYWYPYAFSERTDKPEGLSVELLEVISQRLGITLKAVEVDSWTQAIEQVRKNQIDILPAIAGEVNKHQGLVYSAGFHSSPWVAVIKSNSNLSMSEIRSTPIKVANSRGKETGGYLSTFLPNAVVLDTQDTFSSFKLIDEQKVDVVFSLLSSASPWLQGEMLGKYKIISNISAEKTVDVHFASNEDNQILISLINKVLNELGELEMNRLGDKWSRVDINQGIDKQKLLKTSLIVASVFCSVIGIFLFWNRKLKQEVKHRADAEKRARDAEFEINSLADAIPGAVVQFTIDGQGVLDFNYLSQGIERLTPYKQAEVMAKPGLFFKGITEEELQQLIEAKKRSADLGEAFEVEFRTCFEQGIVNWLQLVAFPQKMSNQQVWNGVLLNINERKEQEFALSDAKRSAEQAAKTKSQFLAMMSHEIRTPISGIIGMLELHALSSLNKAQLSDVKNISNSANNLLHILNDVLDHSKMEAGQLTVEEVSSDLLQLTENALQTHANIAQAKGIALEFDFDTQLKNDIQTDPVRLQQVLSNLISNAIKFTAKGKVLVRVELERDFQGEQTIGFAIVDTGIGISPSNLRKLFTPFTQAESSTSRKYGGTGLGLTISKMLIERLGGEIKVESVLGEGTTFSFSLTVKAQGKPFLPELESNKPLLLIDDGSFAAEKIKRYLQIWHYPLITLPCYENNLDKIKPSIPRGECVFICHESLITQNNLVQEYPDACWIELSERQFSPAPENLFLSNSPLMLSKLISVIEQSQADEDHDLLNIIANDDRASESMTKQEAADSGQLILVAEDHPTNQMVIKRQLEQLNFHADFVDDGEQALAAILQQNYGLLLTDCHMPHMDGYQLTETLREQGNAIPIIALTANALTGEAERCKNLGMDGYLTKPVSMALLKQAIEKHMIPNKDHSLSSIEHQQSHGDDILEQLLADDELARQDHNQAVDTHEDEAMQALIFEELADDCFSVATSEETLDSFSETSHEMHSQKTNTDLIDVDELIAMFGDLAVVKQLLAEFVSSTQESLTQLQDNLLRENYSEVTLMAHKIKGSAAMISATQLQGIASQLEQSAKQEMIDDIEKRSVELADSFAQFRQYIETQF